MCWMCWKNSRQKGNEKAKLKNEICLMEATSIFVASLKHTLRFFMFSCCFPLFVNLPLWLVCLFASSRTRAHAHTHAHTRQPGRSVMNRTGTHFKINFTVAPNALFTFRSAGGGEGEVPAVGGGLRGAGSTRPTGKGAESPLSAGSLKSGRTRKNKTLSESEIISISSER